MNYNLEKYNLKKDTLANLQILTDSSIKYAFGYHCSKAGIPPLGRQAIDKLIELHDFESIKEVLDGQNNVGKIYAIEVLLSFASQNKYALTESDKGQIKGIINQNYLINRCEGCFYSSVRTIELFNEKRYKNLLAKNEIQINE